MVPLLSSLHPSLPSAGNSGVSQAGRQAASHRLPHHRKTEQHNYRTTFPEYVTCKWLHLNVTVEEVRGENRERCVCVCVCVCVCMLVCTVGGSRLSLHHNKRHRVLEDTHTLSGPLIAHKHTQLIKVNVRKMRKSKLNVYTLS